MAQDQLLLTHLQQLYCLCPTPEAKAGKVEESQFGGSETISEENYTQAQLPPNLKDKNTHDQPQIHKILSQDRPEGSKTLRNFSKEPDHTAAVEESKNLYEKGLNTEPVKMLYTKLYSGE